MDINVRFDLVSDDYLEFDRIKNKRSLRPDLHAFLLLDELFPGPGQDMICSSRRDEFYLAPSDDQIEILTDEQILELTRCGVRYDGSGSLCMFA